MSGIAPGPWIMVREGVPIIKRQVFDNDGNHAGYELLDGDYTNLIAARQEAAAALRAALPIVAMNDLEGDATRMVSKAIARVEGGL